MANWAFDSSLNGTKPPGTVDHEMDASLTFAGGDPLIVGATGKLTKTAAQTDRPEFVATGAFVATATGGETAGTLAVGRGAFIWKMPFTPIWSRKVATTSTTTSIVLPTSPATYNANDYKGGTLYNHTTGEQRTITASDNPAATAAGTFTVTQPFAAVGTGHTFSATPLGKLVREGKLVATTFDAPSQAIADLTGGYMKVTKVDIKRGLVYCVVI